jgi:hypothetical protein
MMFKMFNMFVHQKAKCSPVHLVPGVALAACSSILQLVVGTNWGLCCLGASQDHNTGIAFAHVCLCRSCFRGQQLQAQIQTDNDQRVSNPALSLPATYPRIMKVCGWYPPNLIYQSINRLRLTRNGERATKEALKCACSEPYSGVLDSP